MIDKELQAKIKKDFGGDLVNLEKAGLKPAKIDRFVKMKIRVGNKH